MKLVRRSIRTISGRLYVLLDYTFEGSAEFNRLLNGTRTVQGAFMTVLMEGHVNAFIGNAVEVRTVHETPYDLIPALGHVIIAAPAKGEVNITIQGRTWSLRMGEHVKRGQATGQHHEALLNATIEALAALKQTDGVYAKRLSLSSQHIAAMLKGEMRSNKHPALLTEVRRLLDDKGVVLTGSG